LRHYVTAACLLAACCTLLAIIARILLDVTARIIFLKGQKNTYAVYSELCILVHSDLRRLAHGGVGEAAAEEGAEPAADGGLDPQDGEPEGRVGGIQRFPEVHLRGGGVGREGSRARFHRRQLKTTTNPPPNRNKNRRRDGDGAMWVCGPKPVVTARKLVPAL